MYEVAIENEACVILCEITDLVVQEPRPGVWTSDWDAQGYRELEFRAVAGKWFDADGSEHDLGRNGCAEVADRYAEYIEQQLWKQIDAEAMASA